MLAQQRHGMNPELDLVPHLHGHMAGITVDIQPIMGADMTGVAIRQLHLKLKIRVTIQAHRHRADDITRHRVETMPHLSMTIAANQIQ